MLVDSTLYIKYKNNFFILVWYSQNMLCKLFGYQSLGSDSFETDLPDFNFMR